jgi:restriction system protein
MPIPDYQTCMLPVMRTLADGKVWRLRDITTNVSTLFGLGEAERGERLESGQQTVISNRVAWAKTYLEKAGLVECPSRGMVQITDRGRSVLARGVERIDNTLLNEFPTFAEFRKGITEHEPVIDQVTTMATPEESLESAHRTLLEALADGLLEKVKVCSPAFFERLVVDLLLAMGYGGSMADAGQAIGQPGDGGIDGTIKEDKLGLSFVYIQAKRWKTTVGRPEVQAFAGSMEGVRGQKGVLLTTAKFSAEATEYVKQIGKSIVLVDGPRLAKLMIEHDVAVSTVRSFAIKKMDYDYFAEEGEE